MKWMPIFLLCLPLAVCGGELDYTYPTAHLAGGQSLGNLNSYVTLDRNTDIPSDSGSVRFGLRESTDQKCYLRGWKVQVSAADGAVAEHASTIFHPESQETVLRIGAKTVRNSFSSPLNTALREQRTTIWRLPTECRH